MKIVLSVVGPTADPIMRQGIEKYQARLRHYVDFEINVIADKRLSRAMTETAQKQLEGEALLAYLKPGDMLILLDERGRQFTSREFAGEVERRMASGCKRLIYAVGGPYGFSEEVYARADSKISLSKMTFSHEMVRLFFVEQLYRAMTILRGEPYHHD
ncbi:MAG: 23S rRNA (pseudouridine(1915)-N(3))-methyltransferase RlmH [Paramuribaculum sp.]|nr:23S rRNA (pseudouridine(1915)-N(3))-methyltransferase RlmH [Paramuribaculum sp.]